MTKKEQDLQSRLLDLLEANTKVLGTVYDLLLKIANPLIPAVTPGPPVAEEPEAPEAPEETSTEITPEYCRKALKAITKKLDSEKAKAFLATFGGAKTIPQLDKKHYETFIAQATAIMEAE